MKEKQKNKTGFVGRAIGLIEKVGNWLPDPAILFLICLIVVWILSWFLSDVTFTSINPQTKKPIVINNLLSGKALAVFLSQMVGIFTGFAPLGVVLVAMLGVGVADRSGFINSGLKLMLSKTSSFLLTPMVIFVGILSHSAVDAGYVLVIPLGAVIFYAAGRHPLAGIAAAFAGVSGGFSANPLPSALDPMLQSYTQEAAQNVNADVLVNPLCNYYFTAASSLLIVGLGWFVTDKIIEPRLKKTTPVDSDAEGAPDMSTLESRERKGFWGGMAVLILGLILLVIALWPEDSPLRGPGGELTSYSVLGDDGKMKPSSTLIMKSIVPLIFLLFLLPGMVYGFISGTFKKSKDVIDAMTKSMQGMGYYVVMAFFCALFVHAFKHSNIGALLAIEGAGVLKSMNLPGEVTIMGIIFLSAFVNLFVGSASAKWALLGPIFVPMLMQLNLSPELTQAAYRVGDSASNIVTPLMPYFPLVVVFCQKYVKKTGIGTLVSIMIPYSVVFLVSWTLFLVAYWLMGIPLGLQASYTFP